MATYIVTGGTGFIGRHVIPLLLEREPDAQVHVLVRPGSVESLAELSSAWAGGDRVHPLIGDLTAPGLGLDGAPPAAENVLHLGAIYDLTVGEEQSQTNVDGTRAVIDLARELGATLHHMSSIAVAGDYRGTFSEHDFDLGQGFQTPYHRTKFESERLVREAEGLRWRIYRPSAVVGDSKTGEITKIDGPYYFFPLFRALAHMPASLPVPSVNIGATNVIPVDYVAAATVELMRQPGRDGQVFHLLSPRPQPLSEITEALTAAAGGPRRMPGLPAAAAAKPFLNSRSLAGAMARFGVPADLLKISVLPTVFTSVDTEKALEGTGIRVPEFSEYAGNLWRYWEHELDPNRNRRDPEGGPLVGRHVMITGASSGIGRASALAVAAKGATVILLARRGAELDEVVNEIREAGGSAFGYPCDITDAESVEHTIKAVLSDHDHVDMLVNNAGRSIRRALHRSTDRMHDFERTMAVNYFGAVRLILALLPQMRDRRFGHIVNISSAGVQFSTPRFAAYVASKAALDKFTEVAAAEMLADGVTFTTIHMPLVKTPMIAPTKNYEVFPSRSPEWAAALVVRALTERPKRIDTPGGTAGEYWGLFNPRIKDLALHELYRRFPDSPAAKGEALEESDESASASEAPTRTREQRRPPKAVRVVARTARKATKLIPGVYW